MSQSGRPSPVQPPLIGQGPDSMAQTQRRAGFAASNFAARQEQRAPGPQLPPIYSISPDQAAYGRPGRPVQLPPVQVPPMGGAEYPTVPPRVRSIPVAQLLSASPTLPSRSIQPVPTQQQQQHHQTVHKRTVTETHFSSPVQYRPIPTSYPPPSQHHFEQAHMPIRQQPPLMLPYQVEQQYPRAQYPPNPATRSKQPPPPPPPSSHFSPIISAYSSPSYAHSEASPRSSLGPQSHSGVALKPRVSVPPPLNYDLSIRQQPAAARACGFGERDRRVIDPPPILELKITETANGYPAQDPNGLLALHCTLVSPEGHDDETELPPVHPDMPSQQRMMGSTFASPFQAKDENGIAGTFFVFPDMSCRSPGAYRLRFRLVRIDPTNMAHGSRHGSVAVAVSDVFNVYTAKDFPGMRASSALLKSLRRQGLNVGVKKGSEARKGKGKTKKPGASNGSSSEGEENISDGEGGSSSGVSPKAKARKKTKRRKQSE